MIDAPNSERALDKACCPSVCIDLSVSAVAIPEGNGSCSMLISWRFSGIAMNTPNAETAPIHVINSHQVSCLPVVRYSAGIAETNPADDIYPAALAALDIV